MAKQSILSLVFGKQPKGDDRVTASIGEVMKRHRDSLHSFERAVQDLLDSNARQEAELKQLRGVSPRALNGRR